MCVKSLKRVRSFFPKLTEGQQDEGAETPPMY